MHLRTVRIASDVRFRVTALSFRAVQDMHIILLCDLAMYLMHVMFIFSDRSRCNALSDMYGSQIWLEFSLRARMRPGACVAYSSQHGARSIFLAGG